MLRFEQPTANSFPFIGSNHNGGHLFIDNNGLLMIAIGDGGDANDTGNGHSQFGNGADPTNLFGALIRIDPFGNNSANGKYGIPTDNPFYGHETYLERYSHTASEIHGHSPKILLLMRFILPTQVKILFKK